MFFRCPAFAICAGGKNTGCHTNGRSNSRVSDELLSGLDVVHDSIEEIIASLSSDALPVATPQLCSTQI